MEDTELLLRNAMEHHGAAVYRLALCRMQSVQDAEDVYQTSFSGCWARMRHPGMRRICGPGCCGAR